MKSMLFTFLLAGTSLLGMANGGNRSTDGNDRNGNVGGANNSSNASTAEVKCISGKDGEYLFNVIYNNANGSRFSVTVLDADGNQLFQNLYSDKKFDKKFKLADPDAFAKLTFVIRNYGDNSVQRWEVNANNKIVEDIEVKEVK
ncbi:MAG TPA: hypothetical protein VK518_07655 [Puia sp.]|nr:hypothetical protein [Puia sp.]